MNCCVVKENPLTVAGVHQRKHNPGIVEAARTFGKRWRY
jgi:hypothetical protein